MFLVVFARVFTEHGRSGKPARTAGGQSLCLIHKEPCTPSLREWSFKKNQRIEMIYLNTYEQKPQNRRLFNSVLMPVFEYDFQEMELAILVLN